MIAALPSADSTPFLCRALITGKKIFIYLFTHTYIHIYIYIYISRIRRNLSIHIARFSASESLRAYTNTPKNPHFSLVAGASLIGMRLRARQRMRQHPHVHSISARVATRRVDNSSRFISSLLAYSLSLFINFCFYNSLITS